MNWESGGVRVRNDAEQRSPRAAHRAIGIREKRIGPLPLAYDGLEMTATMRILLTESTPGAADEPEKRLREAGYDISYCHPDHRADIDECVVLRGMGHCPLRTDSDIGMVVDARSDDGPAVSTARELGACCALRHHVPLVVAGPARTERFPWSEASEVCTTDEVVGVCERLTWPGDDVLRRDAERVARAALQANGFVPDVDVTIAHAAGSTAVFLHVLGRSDDTARAEAAGLVRAALRGRKDLDGEVTVVTVPPD